MPGGRWGGGNKKSVRTSWQLEKNRRAIKQHHWEHWMAAPASSSSLFKVCRKNNIRCYEEKTNLRQSEQQWDWPERRVVGTGFLKLCERLRACRSDCLFVSRGDRAKGGPAHDLAPCRGQALPLIKNAWG